MRTSAAILVLCAVLATAFISSQAAAGTPGHLKWARAVSFAPGVILSSPALARNGTVYAAGADGNLYAVYPNGTMRWIYEAGSPLTTNPAVYYSPDKQAPGQGRIFVGTEDGRVLCIDYQGNLVWEFPAGSTITAAPAIAADGTVYVGIEPTTLVAINPNGTEKWTFEAGEPGSIYAPSIGHDGTIYFGVQQAGWLVALNPDGTTKWIKGVPGGVRSPVALGADGTIYVSSGLRLQALTPDGYPKWDFFFGLDGWMFMEPTLGDEESVYCCTGALTAVNADGSWRWDFWYNGERPPAQFSAPAVDSNGLIYFGARDGYVYCVAPDGGPVWRYGIGLGDWITSPLIGDDGILYITATHTVYAIYTGADGAYLGPWPMLRRDSARNARVDWLWYMKFHIKRLSYRVIQSDIKIGTKQALKVKLDAALAAAERRQPMVAVHNVGAFVRQVEALEGKKISPELAGVLMRDAEQIMMYVDGDADGN